MEKSSLNFVEFTVDAQRRLYRLKPEPLQAVDVWLAPFRRFWSADVHAFERHLDHTIHANEKENKEKKMTDRELYTPGPASEAQVRKDGEKWTLILVGELRHSPENHGEAHRGEGTHAAGFRNDSDASRRSQGA